MSTDPRAVVLDGSTIRIWESNATMGDDDHLIDTLAVPKRCITPAQRRQWFEQTLYAKSLGQWRWD